MNSPKFIVAGASAIGVGAELFPPEGLTHRQENRIHELARRFLNMVREGRRSLPAASI